MYAPLRSAVLRLGVSRRLPRLESTWRLLPASSRLLCSTPLWETLPNGVRMQHIPSGDQGDEPVVVGQTVRVDYVARLDDGSIAAHGTSSWKIGSSAVCEALDEGVVGMCVGDRRRMRAPPGLRRGAALAKAPAGEFIEYEVHMTGAVHHMQVVTVERPGSDDPLQMMWEFSKKSLIKVFGKGTSSKSKGD